MSRPRSFKPAYSHNDELEDLASPVTTFGRDWCNVRPGECVARGDLYDA